MIPPALVAVYAVVIGLVVGSYLNVVIHRVPRGQATVMPRSRCTWCGGGIAARDNIPVLSWLLLRGRCRRCGAPISARYPAVEALTGSAFLAVALRFGPTIEACLAAVLVCLLIVLAFIDLEHLLLPDRLVFPGLAVGLAVQPWWHRTTLLDALLGVAIGAGVLILLINVWFWLRGEEGMGLGDVNLLALVGAWLGWQGALLTLGLGAAAGALVGIALIAGSRLGMRSRMPFGTFLAAGAFVTLIWGERLLAAYRPWL